MFLDVSEDPHVSNTRVVDFRLDDDMPLPGLPLFAEATLRHEGSAPREDLTVEFRVAGPGETEFRKVAETHVAPVEDGHRVRFPIRFLESGPHRLQVNITGDHLPADDNAHLTVHVRAPLRILVVDGDHDPRRGAAFFLRHALSPVDPDGVFASPMLTEVIPPAELGQLRLHDYRAVVLANPPPFSPAETTRLLEFIQAGGGVVFFPGSHSTRDAHRGFLETAGFPAIVHAGRLDLPEEGIGFSTSPLTHPVVAAFDTPDDRPFLADPRIYRALNLQTSDADLDSPQAARAVLRFADGSPALLEQKRGRGLLMVSAFALDREASDLVLRPAFPPLVLRTVQHAAQREVLPGSLRVHEALVMPLRGAELLQSWSVTSPGGQEMPLPVPASAAPGERAVAARFDRTSLAGFYGAGAAEGTAAPRWFAVNPPEEAGRLAALQADGISERFPELPFDWVRFDEDVLRAITARRIGTEIWRPLALLALACLIAEWLLLALWAPREGTI